MKRVTFFLRRIFAATVFLLALLLFLLPLLGMWFPHHATLGVLAELRFQYALAAAPVVLFALALRSRRLIALAGLAAVFNGAAVVPWYFGKPAPGDGEPLRILSFNVLGSNQSYEAVEKYLRSADPDLAAFQEVSPAWSEKLRPLASVLPYHYAAPNFDMEVHCRWPLHFLDSGESGSRRGFVRLRVESPAGEFQVIATHAYPPRVFGGRGYRWRTAHLRELLPRAVEDAGDAPLVLLGDLNATMWSPHYAALLRQTGLTNTRRGFGVHPSCAALIERTRLLATPLDHILISGHFTTRKFQSGPFLGSDHVPVIADLLLRDQ